MPPQEWSARTSKVGLPKYARKRNIVMVAMHGVHG
jgi:hypothetical protein